MGQNRKAGKHFDRNIMIKKYNATTDVEIFGKMANRLERLSTKVTQHVRIRGCLEDLVYTLDCYALSLKRLYADNSDNPSMEVELYNRRTVTYDDKRTIRTMAIYYEGMLVESLFILESLLLYCAKTKGISMDNLEDLNMCINQVFGPSKIVVSGAQYRSCLHILRTKRNTKHKGRADVPVLTYAGITFSSIVDYLELDSRDTLHLFDGLVDGIIDLVKIMEKLK